MADCGEGKRRLLNLFPIHDSAIHDDHNMLHPPPNQRTTYLMHQEALQLTKSVFNLTPKKDYDCDCDCDCDWEEGKRLLKLFPARDYSSVVVDHAPLITKSPRKRFMQEDSSHTQVTKSVLDYPPKKRLAWRSNSPPVVTSLSVSNLPIKKRLTSRSKDSSVNIGAPVTSPSLSDLPIKKRWTRKQDLQKKTESPSFATQRKEDECHSKKTEEFIEMREKFTREKGLATEKATKKCGRREDEDVDDQNHHKMKKRNSAIKTNEEQLKQFITSDQIKGTDMKLVIQKALFSSDLKQDQNRLNMPINRLVTQDFLTEDEKKFLAAIVDNHKEMGIEVRLVGPKLQMFKKPMRLKMWQMRSTKNYVLKTNWNSFVADNKAYLEVDTKIRVWSFRKDHQLCFAISIV